MNGQAVFVEDDISHIIKKLKNIYEDKLVEKWAKESSGNINKYFQKYKVISYEVNKKSYMGILIDCKTIDNTFYIKVVPKMINRYISETDTLQRLPNNCTCEFFEFDDINNIFVMEKVLPGSAVTFFDNKETILSLFIYLSQNRIEIDNKISLLHKDFADIVKNDYNIYLNLYNKFDIDNSIVRDLYNKFILEYNEISNNTKYLLHGDIYENNMLKSKDSIKIIDPLGFIAPYIIEYTPICAYELLNRSNNYKETYSEFVNFFKKMVDESNYKKALFCQLVKLFIPSIYEANDGGLRARKLLDIINSLYSIN